MKIFDTQDIENSIKYVKNIGNNTVFVWDLENVFQTIVYSSNEVKVSKKIRLPNLPQHETAENKIDVSPGATYLAICDDNAKNCRIINYQEKKPLFNVDWHKGIVESCAFDFQNRYIATGGQDGKTCVWSLHTGKLIMSGPPHADFVTVITFNKHGNMLATGSFDKKIHVLNLSKAKDPVILHGYHEGFMKILYFISDHRLVSSDHRGNLNVWNYVTGQHIIGLRKLPSEPVAMSFVFDFKYMIIGCKDKNIYVYDMKTYKMVVNTFMRVEEGVADFAYLFQLSLFCIGTPTGKLYAFDMEDDVLRLENFIDLSEYDKAYALVKENPLLFVSEHYVKLEKRWSDYCEQTFELLEDGNREQARKLMEPFYKVPEKRGFINDILREFEDFPKFVEVVKQKRYALAYTIAHQHPSFQTTKPYMKMEDIWNRSIEKVKVLILQNKTDIDEKIDKVLHPFKGIPGKAQVIAGIKQDKAIIQLFRQKLDKKDFTACFALARQNPFLKELKDYDLLLGLEEKIYTKALELSTTSNYRKTQEYIQQLMKFPKYRDEADKMNRNIKKTIEFYNHYANKDFNSMLEVIDEAPFLENTEEYQEFNSKWNEAVKQAEMYAAKGNVKGILEVMGDYRELDERVEKIGSIVSTAYINQLHFLAKKFRDKPQMLLRFINRYIDIFGNDENIEIFIDNIEKNLDIDFDPTELRENEKNYRKWSYMDLPDKIFE